MEKITSKEAARLGLTRYFTGKPCNNGHVSERKVSSRTCVECDREKARRERDEKPALVAARKRREAERNADRIKTYGHVYYRENKEKILSDCRARYYLNHEARKEQQRNYAAANRARILARVLQSFKDKPGLVSARNARRRAAKRCAVPVWFSEFDRFVWEEAAALVAERGRLTNVKWEADHMIPLAGSVCCGLHVAENCQVIPKVLNAAKGNRFILTSPLEWISSR